MPDLARAIVGVALFALAVRPPDALRSVFAWQPFQLGVYAIGILALVGVALPHATRLLRARRAARPSEALATAAVPTPPADTGVPPDTAASTDSIAAEVAAPPAPSARLPRARRLDLALPLALTALALAAHLRWLDHANPNRILSGYDYNTYVLNALAANLGDWGLYNPDKRAFHSRFVGWLASEDDLRPVLIHVSVASAVLLAPVTYAVARLAAGPWTALVAALYLLAWPLPWNYATQSTAYPFFYTLVTAAAGAVVWAVARPSLLSGLVGALLVGAATATQEKAAVVLLPVLGLAGIVGLPALWRHRPRWEPPVAAALLFGGAALFFALAKPPVRSTPLVSLMTNQREEVHVDLPYTWPVVRNPDVNDPAGLRSWLPRSLWDSELESWAAGLRTPPDSNGLRLDFTEGRARWTVRPNTTLAPLKVRLERNLRELRSTVGPIPWVAVALAALGAVGLAARRNPVPVALVGVFASGLAPLTLKFGAHYLPQLLPTFAVVAICGIERLIALLVPGRVGLAARAVALLVLGAHALAMWTGNADAWRAPRLTFPPPAAIPKDDPAGYSLSMQRVAEWIATQDHPGKIADCVPGSMIMVAHRDDRFAREVGDAKCTRPLAAARPGDWVVASSHMEYRSPNLPSPRALVAAGWVPVYGWGPQGATTALGFPSNVTVLEYRPSGN